MTDYGRKSTHRDILVKKDGTESSPPQITRFAEDSNRNMD